MDKLISDEFGDSSCESIQLPSSSGSGELCNIEMNGFGSDVKIAAKGKEKKESGNKEEKPPRDSQFKFLVAISCISLGLLIVVCSMVIAILYTIEHIKTENENVRDQISKLNERHATEYDQLNDQLREMNVCLDESNEPANAEHDDINEKLQEMNSSLNKSNGMVEHIDVGQNDLKEQLMELKSILQRCHEHTDAANDNLKYQLMEINSSSHRSIEDINAAHEDIKEQLEEMNSSLQRSNEIINAAHDDLKEQLNEMNTSLRRCNENIDAEHDYLNEELLEINSSLHISYGKIEAGHDDLKEQLIEMNSSLLRFNDAGHDDFKEQLVKMNSSLHRSNDAGHDDLKEQLVEMNSSFHRSNEHIKDDINQQLIAINISIQRYNDHNDAGHDDLNDQLMKMNSSLQMCNEIREHIDVGHNDLKDQLMEMSSSLYRSNEQQFEKVLDVLDEHTERQADASANITVEHADLMDRLEEMNVSLHRGNEGLHYAVDLLDKFNHYAESCDFDDGTLCNSRCAQSVTDDANWMFNNGSTGSSNTGPSSDHTSGYGRYLYLEASPLSHGNKAELNCAVASLTRCVRFYYHSYGSSTGSLTIRQRNLVYDLQTDLLVFQNVNQNQWQLAEATISDWATVIDFIATRGSDYYGDIAIDDITFDSKPCA